MYADVLDAQAVKERGPATNHRLNPTVARAVAPRPSPANIPGYAVVGNLELTRVVRHTI